MTKADCPRTPKPRILILPNRNGIEVWKRAIQARKVAYNYAVIFRDVNGWGIQLQVSDWCTKGKHTYIND